jgi:hypothetical protein
MPKEVTKERETLDSGEKSVMVMTGSGSVGSNLKEVRPLGQTFGDDLETSVRAYAKYGKKVTLAAA